MPTETKVTHTPGPWTVTDGSAYRVMSANKVVHGGVEFGIYICDTANNAKTRTPENAANARLIAAAPELLIALKQITAAYRACYPEDSAGLPKSITDAHAAIAKAEAQ